MSDDDVIGTIEGTATFEQVTIRPAPDSKRTLVEGYYHESTTTYSAPPYSISIGGLTLGDLAFEGMFTLLPDDEEDGWIWVEATKDILRITDENPEESND